MSDPKSMVEVTAHDVQGPGVVACPNPKMTLWSSHPKVFIDLSHDGRGKCPYCGTVYKLKAGEVLHHAH
ncbi:zinc-finger domain-containing protein [Roseateles koreensis]|uniref:Zinc-finger domain-containing protein n=1 Tax=Roseateles koreensis TaxID=2987526 RepID=A0ABT5KPJ7_9BURK|nr:zinc-finger domain-containing protein [Roseateles koreensis]MDC8784834.1 zinc-finger domain-containing protein [Roseateles koreensis]